MTEHEKQADRLDDEADALEQRSSALGEHITAAKEQVEKLHQDDTVPTADASASDELPPPEPDETD